jgi:hypothetical protein
MNWEQKMQALMSLAMCHLVMHRPGHWYVQHSGVEVGGNGFLHGAAGRGKTPEEAVNDHWRELVDELPADRFVVIEAYAGSRREVRWNGFMWEAVVK